MQGVNGVKHRPVTQASLTGCLRFRIQMYCFECFAVRKIRFIFAVEKQLFPKRLFRNFQIIFLRATGEFKGYSITYKGLSMEDM